MGTHLPTALCHSVKTNTDSLVKGGGGGGGGGGEKVMVESAPPPVSPGSACFSLFFVVICARDCEGFFLIIFPGSKILAGKSPAGPPTLRAQSALNILRD